MYVLCIHLQLFVKMIYVADPSGHPWCVVDPTGVIVLLNMFGLNVLQSTTSNYGLLTAGMYHICWVGCLTIITALRSFVEKALMIEVHLCKQAFIFKNKAFALMIQGRIHRWRVPRVSWLQGEGWLTVFFVQSLQVSSSKEFMKICWYPCRSLKSTSPIKHPLIPHYFISFRNGMFRSNSRLRQLFFYHMVQLFLIVWVTEKTCVQPEWLQDGRPDDSGKKYHGYDIS